MATDDNNSEKSKPLTPIEEAQLRKLQLEIDALAREASEEASVGVSKQEKIKLEVKTLLWQTGRVYRLSQLAVIVSIFATLVTIFATGYGIWTSYKKDNETRVKERSDRTDNLYRVAIQRLIQYPVEPKMTISDAVFTLSDLEDVVSNSYEDENKRNLRKKDAGKLLAQLMNSPEVDLSLTRNVEFDRKAMNQSPIYRDFLVNNPRYNRDIISKYKNVMAGIHKKAPCYSMIPDPTTKEVFIEMECQHGEPEPTFLEYVGLFYAYKLHVAILESTTQIPELAAEATAYQNLSFCWFFRATENELLTMEIFGGDSNMVRWKWDVECQQR